MYWNRCSATAKTLTTRGTTLNFQLLLQLLDEDADAARFAAQAPLLSRARPLARVEAHQSSFVLRSARDEALLEETLRFNLVAARTDLTLAQALSLGLLVVPMVVVLPLPTRAAGCLAQRLNYA